MFVHNHTTKIGSFLVHHACTKYKETRLEENVSSSSTPRALSPILVDPLLQFTSSALSRKKPALKKTVGRSLLQPTASALNRKKPALIKRFTFFAIDGTFRQRCVFRGVRSSSSLANRREFLRHFSDDRILARCVNDRFCPFSSKVRMVQLLLMMTKFLSGN